MRREFKVLIIGLNYAPEVTGIAPYTSGLAAGLVKRGFDVRVITAHPHYPAWKIQKGYGGWATREQIDGVDVTRLAHYIPAKPEGIRRLLSEVSFGFRVLLTRWGRPDAVVMVTPALFATSLAMGKAKIMRNKPAILVWVQDLYGLGISETGSAGGLVGRIVTGVEQRTLASASGVAVIHPRFAKHVTQNLGVDPNRLGIVRNWTHLQSLPVVDVPSVRSIHGWNAEETVVLHAGNMGVKQGLANVVAAARLADAQSLPLRFVLLGNGSQLQSLKSQATGIARIQFIETLPEGGFQEALAAADILLVNEKLGVSEMAVPSKLTSYFSTGRPVIAVSDMDGATAGEVLSAGAGLVVEPADPQLLLEAALLLSKNPKIAAGYGANGLRYRQLFLSDEAAILNFENFIRSVSERLSGEPDHK